MHAHCVNRRIFWRDFAAWAKGGFVRDPVLQHLIGQQDSQWLILGKFGTRRNLVSILVSFGRTATFRNFRPFMHCAELGVLGSLLPFAARYTEVCSADKGCFRCGRINVCFEFGTVLFGTVRLSGKYAV